jgi:hypothetical protein
VGCSMTTLEVGGATPSGSTAPGVLWSPPQRLTQDVARFAQ